MWAKSEVLPGEDRGKHHRQPASSSSHDHQNISINHGASPYVFYPHSNCVSRTPFFRRFSVSRRFSVILTPPRDSQSAIPATGRQARVSISATRPRVARGVRDRHQRGQIVPSTVCQAEDERLVVRGRGGGGGLTLFRGKLEQKIRENTTHVQCGKE